MRRGTTTKVRDVPQNKTDKRSDYSDRLSKTDKQTNSHWHFIVLFSLILTFVQARLTLSRCMFTGTIRPQNEWCFLIHVRRKHLYGPQLREGPRQAHLSFLGKKLKAYKRKHTACNWRKSRSSYANL